jgi:hypothetical protein
MTWRKRIAPIAAAVSIGIAAMSVPALGASTTHWTTKKCTSYAKAFHKKHPHATKAQVVAANKTLKKHGCALRVRGGA